MRVRRMDPWSGPEEDQIDPDDDIDPIDQFEEDQEIDPIDFSEFEEEEEEILDHEENEGQ